MKPFAQLVSLADARKDDASVAARLGIYPAYVQQWRERERILDDGRTHIEPGLEPSAGFIAAALAILSSSA